MLCIKSVDCVHGMNNNVHPVNGESINRAVACQIIRKKPCLAKKLNTKH